MQRMQVQLLNQDQVTKAQQAQYIVVETNVEEGKIRVRSSESQLKRAQEEH